MSNAIRPRYPVYIPSKGRADVCLTAQTLRADAVPFFLVVEPQEVDAYGSRYGHDRLLVLPWDGDSEARRAFCAARGIENGGLIAVRNWIKEHATAAGYVRHWQLDDNMKGASRWYRGKRLPCATGIALAVLEDFVDRYDNVAIAGLNYRWFAMTGGTRTLAPPVPLYLNAHVYSCTLVNNAIPYRWRVAYNDDTDMCLQVLAGGWCTVLLNAFMIEKMQTMTVHGGNTADLYQGDGRLKMARVLERLWPGVVKTDRRWQRPQHVVKDSWRRFDTPLKLKPGIDLAALPKVDEYGLRLVQMKPEVKSVRLRALLAESQVQQAGASTPPVDVSAVSAT